MKYETPSTSQQQKNEERLKKHLDELCSEQKKRRSHSLTSQSAEKLEFAMKTKLWMESKELSKLSKNFNHLPEIPEDAQRVNDFLFHPIKNRKTLSTQASLALMTSLNLSTWQYHILREFTNKYIEGDQLPSYYKIKEEEKKLLSF